MDNKTEKVKLSKVHVCSRNPRTITKDQFEKLKNSLLVFPDMLKLRPIVVDENWEALGGNMRTRALNALAKMEFQDIRRQLDGLADYQKMSEEDQKRVMHFWKEWRRNPEAWVTTALGLTEDQKSQFIIKDNVSFGNFDFDILANEWDSSSLNDWGVPVWDAQFTAANSPAEDADMLDLTPDPSEDDGNGQERNVNPKVDAVDDDYTEEEEEAAKAQGIAKTGDLWQLGEHRLVCGDSTDPEVLKLLMDGKEADLWLTDPPYNVDYAEKEQYKKDIGYGSTVHEVAIANDAMNDQEFRNFLVRAYKCAKDVLKAGGVFYICHADTEGYNFRGALRDVGDMKLSQTLIWAKNQMVFGRQDYHWKHEPILVGWKLGAAHGWYSDRSQTTLLEFDRPQRAELHPTMKPIPLFAYLINNSSKEGEIVLDTFGGSGTTIMACEQIGRCGYSVELSPHYVDVIINRWEKYTGEKAVRLVEGKGEEE